MNTSSTSSSSSTVCKIESLATSLITSLLSLEDGSKVIPGGRGITSIDSTGAFTGARDLASLLKVLSSSHELLLKKRVVTQRELYYSHASFFVSQEQLMKTLEKAQIALGVPRHSLGVFAAGKGWFAGHVSTLEEQDNMASGEGIYITAKTPRAIPSSSVCEEQFTKTSARFILVVEKECVFRRLCDERIWEKMSCVLLTGCGFPDHGTRAWLRQLTCKNETLPIYILTDYNPFGLAIFLNYAFGTHASSEADAFNVPEAIWIGLHFDDIKDFNINPSAMQLCTSIDLKKASSLLEHKNVRDDNLKVRECESWINTRRKCEIEALGSGASGLNMFITYLETKLSRSLDEIDTRLDSKPRLSHILELEPQTNLDADMVVEEEQENKKDINIDEDEDDDEEDSMWSFLSKK